MSDRSIDAQISDLEETFRRAEEEFDDVLSLRIQTISSAEATDQRNTMSGGKEEEKSIGGSEGNNESSDSATSSKESGYNEPPSDQDSEDIPEVVYNAYDEEESEEEHTMTPQQQQSVELTIGGVKLKVRATPTKANDMAKALFPMESRSSYPADKLTALLEAICKPQKNKFDLLMLALEDQDKLEDTYALQMLLESTKEHFTQYGVANVFTVIVFDESARQTILSTQDLLTNHSLVSVEQVAKSNEWYATMGEDELGVCCGQNLTLSATFLMNVWRKDSSTAASNSICCTNQSSKEGHCCIK